MKKFLSFIFLMCFSVVLFAQPTFVSTEPSNRNAIIDDYTGKGCGNCPDAHKYAQTLMSNNPGRVFAITIHQGIYANPINWGYPDLTTPYGDQLMVLAGSPTGYPTGSVNRQNFEGVEGNFLYGREYWGNLANTVMSQSSYVNIAAQGSIDWATRKLTLTVEAYYTGNGVESNTLHIAMLQNEIIDWQGNAIVFPEMMVGPMVGNFALYRHQHVLRDMPTGHNGIDITPVTAESFYTETFTYTIPDYVKEVEVALDDLEFLVFISESNHKIVTGSKATITHTNRPAIAARIPLVQEIPVHNCSGDAQAYARVKNLSENPLTSLELTYSVNNGTPMTYTWNKRSIAPMEQDTVHLPVFQIQQNQNQKVNIEISKVNGQAYASLPNSLSIFKAVPDGDPGMRFVLATDMYAEQVTFKIFNPDETVLMEGGPWENCTWQCVIPRYFDFIPVMPGCHRIEVYDSEGNGINSSGGAGYINLFGAMGNELWYNDGLFDRQATASIDITEVGKMHVVSTSIRGYSNGNISPKGHLYFKEGTDAVFTFTPKDGYIVEQVYIDSIAVPNTQGILSYTIPAVDRYLKFEVSFITDPSLSVTDINGVEISIAPNPVNDQLFVTGLYDKLEIISVTGQVITTINNYQPSVNVNHLAKGFYLAKVYTNGTAATFKIIK